MSLEPSGGRILVEVSPLSSGRSSPVPRHKNEHDETIIKKDPRHYKKFAAGVDRALAVFENALEEWADYISFLARLLKALQAYPSIAVVPSKATVAKRLAQCMNPRLPSGVHQKTLEVYSYIFSLIGHDGLANDLQIWTPGLAPVLSYASISVKPHFLSLLETFYLPLGRDLRPALKSLILSILPGIDEEGSEHFDRTFALLEGIRERIDEETYFWQCLLLAAITSPGRRQGALAFLNRKLPNLSSDDSMSSPLVSPEPGLLVRCFSAGLQDEQLLVQRGFLDLLVTNLPLSSSILQRLVAPDDLESLLASATNVVLRRDMSLNRRLWVWLLGPQPADTMTTTKSSSAEYFQSYGLDSLVRAMKSMLEANKPEPLDRAKPYRVLLSLMDRWEVGGLVVPRLFVYAVRSVNEFETSSISKERYNEVLRSASMFFDGVEPGLIWAEILEILLSSLNTAELALPEAEAQERLQLVAYVLRTFNVTEEEMVIIYAPLVLLALVVKLSSGDFSARPDLLSMAWNITIELLAIIPDRAFTSIMVKDDLNMHVPATEILETISRFFSRDAKKKNAFPPISTKLCGAILLQQVSSLMASYFQLGIVNTACCKLLVNIVSKVPMVVVWSNKDLVIQVSSLLNSPGVTFSVLHGCTNLVAALQEKAYFSSSDLDALILPLVDRHWSVLSPDRPKHHVESSQALWNLQDTLKDRRIEAALATVMAATHVSGPGSRAEPGRRFTVLWNHSSTNAAYNMMLTRPLFLVLDALFEESTELHVFARGWLQSLASTERLFDIFITKLLAFPFHRHVDADTDAITDLRHIHTDDDDLSVCVYHLQMLANVLRYSTESILASLANDVLVLDNARKAVIEEHGFMEADLTFQLFFAKYALAAINEDATDGEDEDLVLQVSKLHRTALSVLHQLLLSPFSQSLAEMALEVKLTRRLKASLRECDTYVQVAILDVLYAALKLSMFRQASELAQMSQTKSPPAAVKTLRIPNAQDVERELPQPTPPAELVQVLIEGISSASTRSVLDSWINFLTECLPLLSPVIFQILLPLVECFCTQIRQSFESLKQLFSDQITLISPETTLVALLNGLEHILAAAHDQLLAQEIKSVGQKSPHEPASFFGNMIPGVFSAETGYTRNTSANNRLTVLLCFQDTVRICYSIWSWGEASSGESDHSASLEYTSFRMRNRARRILEHLYHAETLECLETLIELWPQSSSKSGSVFKLVHVLDNSRPQHTISAVFNAILSRTNPSSLEPGRKSSLTSELTDIDVATFLVDYAKSLEDDAMEEIWPDCHAFLSDVLKSPFPHRQTLPSLLYFSTTLGEKVDNTNFGEQKKMRKDLGDIFLRLLASAFTVRPISFAPDPVEKETNEKTPTDDIVRILADIMPRLRKVLVDQDRVLSAAMQITASVIVPAFRSKSFPAQLPPALLDMFYQITRIPSSQKAWKKELSDAFNDNRFFAAPIPTVRQYWQPLLRQWVVTDKERMPELFARISAPTTAGVLFGVGAASARTEADRKTQLTLRRIATLIFAADRDHFVVNMTELEEKAVELLSATSVTSPSSATRAEIFLVLRALVLRTTAVHLAPFWPLINSELQSILQTLFPDYGNQSEKYSDICVVEACKLLDTLLVIAPDDFQLHEWLFITDSIEAVYRPAIKDYQPVALVDQISHEMGMSTDGRRGSDADGLGIVTTVDKGAKRRPLLRERSNGMKVGKEVKGFLSYLSIWAFENTYAMGDVDWRTCEDVLLGDLFDEGI